MEKFTIYLEKLGEEEKSVEQTLTEAWNDKPSNESEYEFYHRMRVEKMDHKVVEEFVRRMVAQTSPDGSMLEVPDGSKGSGQIGRYNPLTGKYYNDIGY